MRRAALVGLLLWGPATASAQQDQTIVNRVLGNVPSVATSETDAELRVGGFRHDMRALRDGFATVVLAGEVSAIWTLMSSTSYDISVTIIAGTIGGLALVPFSYFARKVMLAKRDLKQLRSARIKGEIRE